VIATSDMFADIDRALERLQHARDPAELEPLVPATVASACRCDRVVLSAVGGGTWVPRHTWSGESADADRIAADLVASGPRSLRADTPEGRACTGPGPTWDTRGTPREIQAFVGSCTVVALIGTTGPFALIHAGSGPGRPALDPARAGALFLLAEGIAVRYERAVLRERLADRLASRKDTWAALESQLEFVASAPVGLEHARAATPVPEMTGHATALTPRQRDVAELLARGCSNASIADQLVIAETTVKFHVKHLMRKLGAQTRSEAVARLHRAEPTMDPPTQD
jgi:LuxR family transcriptional regulator, regulator of acetate metabolism